MGELLVDSTFVIVVWLWERPVDLFRSELKRRNVDVIYG